MRAMLGRAWVANLALTILIAALWPLGALS